MLASLPFVLIGLAILAEPEMTLVAGVMGALALGWVAIVAALVCVPTEWWGNLLTASVGIGFFLGAMIGWLAAIPG